MTQIFYKQLIETNYKKVDNSVIVSLRGYEKPEFKVVLSNDNLIFKFEKEIFKDKVFKHILEYDFITDLKTEFCESVIDLNETANDELKDVILDTENFREKYCYWNKVADYLDEIISKLDEVDVNRIREMLKES